MEGIEEIKKEPGEIKKESESNQKESNSIKKDKKPALDRLIDLLFSNDERKWLLLILILGIILRFLAASNLSPVHADEMVHGPHSIGFLHSGLISTILHSPLWFYLSDIFMKVLGVTMFSMRFSSFIFGSLSIIFIYLIGSKAFNKKVGLISSFFFAISYFLFFYTIAEMDVTAIFFLLAALYSFIISLENDRFPYFSAIFIGLAALVKTLSLFFVPAFLLGFFLFKKEKLSKKNLFVNIKKAFIFGLIILLFFSPILVHNYLWYQDKQMVDTYFAQYFDIGNAREAYSGQLGYNKGFSSLLSLPITSFNLIKYPFLSLDPIIFILGILGIFASILLFKSINKKLFFLLISFELFGFFFLILSGNTLSTHYTTMIPVLCIFAGFFVDKISKMSKSIRYSHLIIIFLSITLIFQIYSMIPEINTKCSFCKLRDYAINSMDKNSIVVVDSRIYRGRTVLSFYDFNYVESSIFPNLLELNNNLTNPKTKYKLYFIECLSDDCGWGTIKDQPDLNLSTEEIIKVFSNFPVEKVISDGGHKKYSENIEDLKIYQTSVDLDPQIIQLIESTHIWFYYPVNYYPKDKIFDNYDVNGPLNSIIYKISWLIIIISIIISIISIFLPLILFLNPYLFDRLILLRIK
ncbi:MAG TPA: glycosyltransferase family 39 protein [Candidatus Paceibacterota bacterium]|nr:glycosyltransferase family 39 protein [Candidatus Paceibacterota bacterium]